MRRAVIQTEQTGLATNGDTLVIPNWRAYFFHAACAPRETIVNRFRWFLFSGLLVAGMAVLCSSINARDFNDQPLVEYEKQLNAILKTRFTEEKEYVREVVKLVGQEKIPRKVVDTSFKWVLSKRPLTNNRFIYFQRVLTLQGKKLSLPIPPFDDSVYRRRRVF